MLQNSEMSGYEISKTYNNFFQTSVLIINVCLFFILIIFLLYLYVYCCVITIYWICIVSWSDELFIVYMYAYMLYDIGK